MIAIVDEAPAHVGARERLLDLCFGEARFRKPSERLRAGRLPVFGFVALGSSQALIATVRLWSVADATGRKSLLLGPLAVDPDYRGQHVGDRLVRHALNHAALHGHGSVVLVGDIAYYARFGFSARFLKNAALPGSTDRVRFLGVDLRPGRLTNLRGVLTAAGEFDHASATRRPVEEMIVVKPA